jgi:hypothetical protein
MPSETEGISSEAAGRVECEWCGELRGDIHRVEVTYPRAGERSSVCQPCLGRAQACQDCGRLSPGAYGMNFAADGERRVCGPCLERESFWCEYCSERHALTDQDPFSVQDAGHYCADGLSYYRRSGNVTECPNCSSFLWAAGEDWEDEEDEEPTINCRNCGYSPEPVARRIHSYSYRPDFHFTTGEGEALRFGADGFPFMGFELELETPHGDRAEALDMLRDLDPDEEVRYCKSDGSLDSTGFEVVFHPRTLRAWHDFGDDLASMLTSLSGVGARGWLRHRCGLHVHLSRDAFGSRSHLGRYAYLVAQNRAGLVDFAGREADYASFDQLRSGGAVRKAAGKAFGYHSDALNLGGHETVELRIFRPSLAVGRVLAALELTTALWDYSGRLSAHDLALGAGAWDRIAGFILEHDDYCNAGHLLRGGRFDVSRTVSGSLLDAAATLGEGVRS